MGKKYKILLVDDDKFLLNMYTLKFSKENHIIETAASSQEALNKIKGGLEADILLIDLVMPTMDGLELLAEIKKEKLLPKAKFIILTNQSQSVDIERAKKIGADGYIVKASTIPSEVLKQVIEIAQK